MYFNRFDIVEAYWVYAMHWGDYELIERIKEMGFNPRPNLEENNLTENSRVIFLYIGKGGWNEKFRMLWERKLHWRN